MVQPLSAGTMKGYRRPGDLHITMGSNPGKMGLSGLKVVWTLTASLELAGVPEHHKHRNTTAVDL